MPLGWPWGPSWGVGGEAVFSLGGWGVFLSPTGESAKQADELEVREDSEEEEDSEEGSEEHSPGSLFLFFWGDLQGALGLGWGLFCFGGWGLFCPGVGVCFGLGGRFWDQGGGLWGGGGGTSCWR